MWDGKRYRKNEEATWMGTEKETFKQKDPAGTEGIILRGKWRMALN